MSAASIRERLVKLARDRGQQAELLLTRFAVERLLYRLSVSKHRERFVLKGALLFDLWFDQSHRPTRDADLLGYGDDDPASLVVVFREIAALPVEADGVSFDADSIEAIDIRQQARYPGTRITLIAQLARARLRVQIDIGFGDVIATPVEQATYPSLLEGLPEARLAVYPKESVLAEKLHILTTLGIANSRLKDYYDLWVLSEQAEFDFVTTAAAVEATFERRATALSQQMPLGLKDDFSEDTTKQAQWSGFLRKTRLTAPALPEVVTRLADFLGPLVLAATDRTSGQYWPAGGPWRPLTDNALESQERKTQ